MPEIRDNKGTQKAPTKLGNEGKTTTTILPAGSQARMSAQPMKPSEDIWTSFTPAKGKQI